jgi:hypothetical protein
MTVEKLQASIVGPPSTSNTIAENADSGMALKLQDLSEQLSAISRQMRLRSGPVPLVQPADREVLYVVISKLDFIREK